MRCVDGWPDKRYIIIFYVIGGVRFFRSLCLQDNRIGDSLLFTFTLILRQVIRGRYLSDHCVSCGVNICLFFHFLLFCRNWIFGDGLFRSVPDVIIWDSLFRAKVRGREICLCVLNFSASIWRCYRLLCLGMAMSMASLVLSVDHVVF